MNTALTKNQKSKALIKTLIVSALVGISIIFALLLLMALLLCKVDLPLMVIDIALIVVMSLGSAIAGFLAVAKIKEKGYLFGMCEGIIVVFIMLVFGLFFKEEDMSALLLIVKVICSILAGALSGIFAINHKQKRIKY